MFVVVSDALATYKDVGQAGGRVVANTAMRRGPSHVGVSLLGLVFGLAHDDSCKLKV